MAALDHEVEVEVQPEEAARGRHGVGLGSGRPLPLNSRRLAELQKRRQYQSPQLRGTERATNQPQVSAADGQPQQGQSAGGSNNTESRTRKCWNCNETGHMAYNCPKPKKESAGRSSHKPVSTKMASSTETKISEEILDDPLQ